MPILKFVWKWILVCQKTLSDISNNLVNNIVNIGLLSNNNYVDNNVDIDAKAKSNLDENMTGNNNNDLFKKHSMINIEKLFQQG